MLFGKCKFKIWKSAQKVFTKNKSFTLATAITLSAEFYFQSIEFFKIHQYTLKINLKSHHKQLKIIASGGD